jgi:thiol-disulfide isomerase/thioredoxin
MTKIGPVSKDKVYRDMAMHRVVMMMSYFWFHDYYFAKQAAANKPPGSGSGLILAYFGGSDWCGNCQNLDAEVFESSTFLNWFKQRQMVPFLADHLHYHPQDPAYLQQNTELELMYGIQAWPQVLALNADGSEIGRLVGYTKGYGPAKWIQNFSAMSGVT